MEREKRYIEEVIFRRFKVETNSEAEASTAEQSEEAPPADTAAAPEQAQELRQSRSWFSQ